MRSSRRLFGAVAVVLLIAVLAQSPAAARPVRDVGPSENRKKIVNMLAEARKLAIEAGRLRKEAVEGRVPDRTKPRVADQDGQPRWIELSDADRLKRFAGAKAKFQAAANKAAEAEAFLESHPGIALEDAPATMKKRLIEQCANTIVAEARFRMAKEIGTVEQWKKLAAQAVAIDPNNPQAALLVEEIKQYEQKHKAGGDQGDAAGGGSSADKPADGDK